MKTMLLLQVWLLLTSFIKTIFFKYPFEKYPFNISASEAKGRNEEQPNNPRNRNSLTSNRLKKFIVIILNSITKNRSQSHVFSCEAL